MDIENLRADKRKNNELRAFSNISNEDNRHQKAYIK